MLPIPEISDWSSSARLTSVSRRRSRRLRTSSSKYGSIGSRAMWAIRRRNGVARAGRAVGDQLVDQHAAEGALVDEAQLRPLVGEADPDVQVPLVGGVGWLDEQLTAHAQVRHHALAGLVERQPEVLPAPRGAEDPARRRGGRRSRQRRRQVAADRPRMATPRPSATVRSDDPPRQAGADGLDLGKLRHRSGSAGRCRRSARRWRARPSRPRLARLPSCCARWRRRTAHLPPAPGR